MEMETDECECRFKDAFRRSSPCHDRCSGCSSDSDRGHHCDDDDDSSSSYYGDHLRRPSSLEKGWRLGDAALSRRRRLASYKAYAAEGRMKASFRKGVRWIKVKCTKLVHGY